MKKIILILSALFLLSGCVFDGPLTEKPTRNVDPALIGSWFSLRDGSALNIYRLSANEYLAVKGGVPFICTHSDINGANFVSCRYIGDSKENYGKFSYYAYKLESDQLVLWTLSDALGDLKALSANQRRARIEDAVKNGTALDTAEKDVERFKKKT